jgi:hypothetical protein
LVETGTSHLIDSLSYNGSTSWAAPIGAVPVQEGTASSDALADNNSMPASICRIPTTQDTNVNATDFKVCGTPTPGAANVQ